MCWYIQTGTALALCRRFGWTCTDSCEIKCTAMQKWMKWNETHRHTTHPCHRKQPKWRLWYLFRFESNIWVPNPLRAYESQQSKLLNSISDSWYVRNIVRVMTSRLLGYNMIVPDFLKFLGNEGHSQLVPGSFFRLPTKSLSTRLAKAYCSVLVACLRAVWKIWMLQRRHYNSA